MANTQTSVPLFVANTVLTAAQQNISAGTGVPVFATTVTRDAAFGGSNKALAEGQLAYIEASNVVQYYDGASWLTVGPSTSGLTLIKTQTISTTVSSVTVTDAFSATYDAYKIVVSGGVGSSNGNNFIMTLGASSTGYYWNLIYTSWGSSTVTGFSESNSSSWKGFGSVDTTQLTLNVDLVNPFLAKNTTFQSATARTGAGGPVIGIHQVATSYTAFTFGPESGTITGGTVRVYGYQNS